MGKMIDNLSKIVPLLNFETEDDFYYVQILKRKKENPDLGSNSYLVKSYQIISVFELISKMGEIINLCEYHNARAYINLNRRSFEKTALEVNLKLANQLKNKDYYSVRKIYDSVCDSSHGINQPKRRWVVDIDDKDETIVREILDFIESIEPITNPRLLTKLETLNGFHLITNGFNSEIFHEKYPDIEIHKNNPTILYIS